MGGGSIVSTSVLLCNLLTPAESITLGEDTPENS